MITAAPRHQLTSSELHERQVAQGNYLSGPVVVAAGITDPSNLGSIFRICDAAGCQRLIFIETADLELKKIKKVSRSTTQTVPHLTTSTESFLSLINQLPPLVAVEITSKSTDLYEAQLPQDVAFVVGGEKYGIPEEILDRCAQAVHLPMFGVNSSMNVASSLAIVLYEWHRRFRADLGERVSCA